MLGRDAAFVVFNPDLTLVEAYVGGNSVGKDVYKRQGLNVARVLGQLGDDVVATGLLGGHMGAYMAELMDCLLYTSRCV